MTTGILTNKERDEKIIEMSTDIKHIKESLAEHKVTHRNYMFLAWSTIIGLLACWFKR